MAALLKLRAGEPLPSIATPATASAPISTATVVKPKRGPRVRCHDKGNVNRRKRKREKTMGTALAAAVHSVVGPGAEVDEVLGDYFRSPHGKRQARDISDDLLTADAGHTVSTALKTMLMELPKAHSKYKACIVRQLLSDVGSDMATKVFNIKAGYHRNVRRRTAEQLRADRLLLAERRQSAPKAPKLHVSTSEEEAMANVAKSCMVTKSGTHSTRLQLLQRLENVYAAYVLECMSGRFYVALNGVDPALRFCEGQNTKMTNVQRNIELALIKVLQESGDDADVQLPEGWEAKIIQPRDKKVFWAAVKNQDVKFTRVHKPWGCEICDRQASLIVQRDRAVEEEQMLGDLKSPEARLLWKRVSDLQKLIDHGELHAEQKENQRPYTRKLRKGLKEGEAEVTEDFVAHYDINGDKIINLIFTVKWKEGGVLKTKYLDNYCSDADSNAESRFFPRHVWEFHLSADGSGELARFKKIFRNGDSGPHFLNNSMMWYFSTVHKRHGIEIEFNTLGKRHAWNECDGEGGRTTTWFRREALEGRGPVTAEQCATSINTSGKFLNSVAYWYEAIDQDPALFPEEFRPLKSIQKMSEVSYFHFDADGEERWLEGIVRAREVSGRGDWHTFDLLRRKGKGYYCKLCTSHYERPVYHAKRDCTFRPPPKQRPPGGGQGPGQSDAGLAAIRMRKALKRDKSLRKCKICELVKRHDKFKRSCQDCVAAKVASASGGKQTKAASAKKVKVARGKTARIDVKASGKSVKVAPAEKAKIPAGRTKVYAAASGKTSAVATGRVAQQKQEMKAGPEHANNRRPTRRRGPASVTRWVAPDSKVSRADGGENEVETQVPLDTELGMVDVSGEDDSDYVDEGKGGYMEEGCGVRRSARKRVARVARDGPEVFCGSSDGDDASEYTQPDRDEESESDFDDVSPNEETESDSDEPSPAVRVTREFWGPPSRDYPQRLYQVELEDGSVVYTPAEDVDDPLEESADTNPFYRGVIARWRGDGNTPPIRPCR
jgi:hypothetical protein